MEYRLKKPNWQHGDLKVLISIKSLNLLPVDTVRDSICVLGILKINCLIFSIIMSVKITSDFKISLKHLSTDPFKFLHPTAESLEYYNKYYG